VATSGLDVYAHNMETVEALTPRVRDYYRAGYRQSLGVLEYVKSLSLNSNDSLVNRHLITKTSMTANDNVLGMRLRLPKLRLVRLRLVLVSVLSLTVLLTVLMTAVAATAATADASNISSGGGGGGENASAGVGASIVGGRKKWQQ